MPDITIRDATPNDAPALARLVTQLGYPATAEQVRVRLAAFADSTEYAVWVAECGGRVVGLTGVFLHRALEYDGWHGRLLGLVVDESFRGTGVGGQLMEWAERRLRERGVNKLTLTSGTQRTEAHKFYRRLGYEQTGLRFGKRLDGPPPGREEPPG